MTAVHRKFNVGENGQSTLMQQKFNSVRRRNRKLWLLVMMMVGFGLVIVKSDQIASGYCWNSREQVTVPFKWSLS